MEPFCDAGGICKQCESGFGLDGAGLHLSDLIDVPSVQSLMDDFHELVQIPMAIVDIKGNVLVGVGWQDICTQFHRIHPETRQRCIESDTELGISLRPGEYKLYKCKNQMWDIVSPIYIGDQHLANVFSGQFFLENESIDEDVFRTQAAQFGFEPTGYLSALRSVPKLSRETVEKAMAFFIKLSRTLSQLGHSNLQLARAQQALRSLNESLELRVSERTAEVRRLAEHLRALAADLTQTEHRERIRMATVLHDHIQQLLVSAHMHIRHGLRTIPGKNGCGSFELADDIVLDAVEASRSLTVELCPPVLRDAGLIAGLGWLAQRMREQNGCEVELITDSRAEPKDEDLKLFLFDAVRELIINATKHSGTRRVTVRLAREHGKGIRITVADLGRGFDAGLLQHRDPSSGAFGLFSIQQRLNYLGGGIEIISAPGKGAHITMALPSDSPMDAPGADGLAALGSIASATAAQIQVMVVDDHKVMRDGLSTMLRLAPRLHIIGEAEDGEEAVQKTRALHPHVILMDVTMPKMDGIEATRIIHQEFPAIKVIGLSMHVDPAIAESMKEAGAVAYLTKGEPIEKVIEAIQLNMEPVIRGAA